MNAEDINKAIETNTKMIENNTKAMGNLVNSAMDQIKRERMWCLTFGFITGMIAMKIIEKVMFFLKD